MRFNTDFSTSCLATWVTARSFLATAADWTRRPSAPLALASQWVGAGSTSPAAGRQNLQDADFARPGKAAREPLSFAGVNTVGLRRRNFDNGTIAHIEDIYRMIYVHNNNMTRALHAADMELPRTAEKSIILDFIKESDKGIIRGPQGV